MTFSPGGNRIQCINDIQILPNSEQERNKVFVVQLDSVNACGEHHTDCASVMIVDSCSQVTTISLAHATYSVGEGEGSLVVCVVLIGESRHKEFTIATMAGSALGKCRKHNIVQWDIFVGVNFCTAHLRKSSVC